MLTRYSDIGVSVCSEVILNAFLQLGAVVEAQFPDQMTWAEGIIMSAKDKSVYTVEFDDGDIRTLTRGQLCIQGILIDITS